MGSVLLRVGREDALDAVFLAHSSERLDGRSAMQETMSGLRAMDGFDGTRSARQPNHRSRQLLRRDKPCRSWLERGMRQQRSIAGRASQLADGIPTSGNFDMIASSETGPHGARLVLGERR